MFLLPDYKGLADSVGNLDEDLQICRLWREKECVSNYAGAVDSVDKKRPCATLHLHRSQPRVGMGLRVHL